MKREFAVAQTHELQYPRLNSRRLFSFIARTWSLSVTHFEIAQFGQYQYYIDLVACRKVASTSHFVVKTEIMQKCVRFRTDVTGSKKYYDS